MTYFSSLTSDRIVLWCGMLLTGGALVIGGGKALEHAGFQPAQAVVTGNEIRCEMTSSGSRQRITQLVMCGDVANVKAQNPDVEWRVSAEPFVTLGFTTAAGSRVSTQVPLSTLHRQTTATGESVAILYRPDRPTWISTQATLTFFALNGLALSAGLMLCMAAFGMQQRRREKEDYRDVAVAPQVAETVLPTVKSPAMWAEPAQSVMTPHRV